MQHGAYGSPSHECKVARTMAELGHEVTLVVEQDPQWDTPIPPSLKTEILPLNEWIQAGEYHKFPVESDFDVAFASSASGGPFLEHWKQMTGKPAVVQFLDIPLWRLRAGENAPWLKSWEPWFRAGCAMDAVVVNTKQTLSDMDEAAKLYGVLPAGLPRREVIYYGIDTEAADAAPSLLHERSGTRRHCVAAARLVPYKGYDFAIAALSLIPKESRPIYHIIGDGPDRFRILEQLMFTESDHILHLGISDRDKFSVIKTADFGLGLAFNPHIPYQFPLEAAYCGKPVIVADIPINRERFQPTDDGYPFFFWVNPFNTDATTGMIRHIEHWRPSELANRDLRSWIQNNRSFRSHANGVLKLLEAVAK